MINGRMPEPYRSCPFRMTNDILDSCKKTGCTWWDTERKQCVVWTIAENLKA